MPSLLYASDGYEYETHDGVEDAAGVLAKASTSGNPAKRMWVGYKFHARLTYPVGHIASAIHEFCRGGSYDPETAYLSFGWESIRLNNKNLSKFAAFAGDRIKLFKYFGMRTVVLPIPETISNGKLLFDVGLMNTALAQITDKAQASFAANVKMPLCNWKPPLETLVYAKKPSFEQIARQVVKVW